MLSGKNRLRWFMSKTIIHESAREWETVIVSGGRLGSQILLSPDDLVKAVDGEMADIVFCENK